MNVAAFVARVLPVILRYAPKIAVALWHRTGGDPAAAGDEIRVWADHRATFRAAQPGFQRRLDAIDAREKKD